MTEKERKILEMQCASTRRVLERSPDLDLEWFNRPIPKEAQVVKEDGSVDLNVRVLSKEEADFYNAEYGASKIYGRKRERGAWFEDARTSYLIAKAKEGKIHPKLLSHIETPHVMPTPIKRERAIDSFMRSKPIQAIKDAFKSIMDGLKELTYIQKTSATPRKSNEE